jgi:hypothetical protein
MGLARPRLKECSGWRVTSGVRSEGRWTVQVQESTAEVLQEYAVLRPLQENCVTVEAWLPIGRQFRGKTRSVADKELTSWGTPSKRIAPFTASRDSTRP